MTFDAFCERHKVSAAERERLFVFLLALRWRKMLRG
jgi:hypothetical protein